MTDLSIVPECYVDTKIAEILGQARRKYNHQHGFGDVSNEMEHSLENIVALGIVDEDRYKGATSKYFSAFEFVKQENNLILKQHARRKHHYLILVCPEAEEWLLEDARKTGLNPSDYDLPPELKGLIKISKIRDIDRHEGFKNLIKALIREQAPSITTLKKWIELFKSNDLSTLLNS
jgi:hypothetical protein